MSERVAAAVAVAMTMSAILSARSDEIPTLDVRPVCRGIASQSADPSEAGLGGTDFQQCLQSEQQVREQLKKEWSTFSGADKQHCVTLSKTGGESSYTELLTCLEMSRDVRTYRSAAAALGKATTRIPSSSSPSSPSLSSRSSPSPSHPPAASPSTSTAQPAPSSNEPSMAMVKELQQAKVDAINAKASKSMAQRKLTDTEADLKQVQDEAARANKEAQQAKADAQAKRQSTEADLKQVKDEAARATKEAQQAKADTQAALQSKAEAEHELAARRAATDPLGTWLRGLSAWLGGIVSSLFA